MGWQKKIKRYRKAIILRTQTTQPASQMDHPNTLATSTCRKASLLKAQLPGSAFRLICQSLLLSAALISPASSNPLDHEQADSSALNDKKEIALQAAQQQAEQEPDNPASYQHLGKVWLANGDVNQAETAYLKALQLAEKSNDRVLQAQVANILSRLYTERKQYDKTLEIDQKALPIYNFLGQQDNLVITYYSMAAIYLAKGEQNQAREAYQQALKVYDAMHNRQGMAQTDLKLGDLFFLQKQYDQAQDMFQNALLNYETIGYQDGMVKAYLSLAAVHVAHADVYKAEEAYQKAIQLYEHTGSQKALAEVYVLIAGVYNKLNVADKVLTMYQKALEIHRNQGNRPAEALVDREIGNVYLKLKEYDKATEVVEKSLEIEQALDNKSGISASYTTLGFLDVSRGDLDKGKTECETAQQINDTTPNIHKLIVAPTASCLGLIYQKKGENGQAIKHYQQSLEIYKNQNPPVVQEIQTLEKVIIDLNQATNPSPEYKM